ncbi:MAG TPA: TlpA disulfide reductase family protein [Pirellulales bacterium]|nr:TlpA disulfide reductase family protein [Pirellulales bacterium]
MAQQQLQLKLGRWRALVTCAGLLAVVLPTNASGEPAAEARTGEGLLVLASGDRLRGCPAVSAKPGEIAWQLPVLAAPLQIPLADVQIVKFHPSPSASHGNYRVELSGGDELRGDLVSVDNNTIVLRTQRGTFQVKRAAVASLSHAYRALRPRIRPLAVEKPVIQKAHVVLRNSQVVYADLVGYDARSTAFSFRAGSESPSYRANEITEIVMADAGTHPGPVSLEYVDGIRLSGELEKVGPSTVVVKSSAFREVVTLPLAGLRSIRASAASESSARQRGEAMLSVGETRLHGRLVAAEPRAGLTSFAWQPSGSSTALAIRAGVTASIDFGPPALSALIEKEAAAEDRIFLRGGDVLTCNIVSIDDVETVLRVAGPEPRHVLNARIKAVEFGPQSRRAIANDKLARLLTVPRLQKDEPPTHVLGSMSDDFLRGRLLAVTDSRIVFQVGSARREFPRERIASVIWLDSADDSPTKDKGAGLVQVTDADGLSLCLADARLDDGCLVGRNELLGDCRLRLEELSTLRLGVPRTLSKLAQNYRMWKLTEAIEPKAFADDADGLSSEPDLVDRLAPDFTLDLLDGSKFRLSSERGRVVVLDFWASWCAPCVKGLPDVASVMAEFDSQKVRLVAINLQETRDDVAQAVERLNLSLSVGLDRDGRVAAGYGANSIPYTVVVGADGKVTRVFVGYGPQFADALKEAITSTLAKPQQTGN